jgi:hypothetical protein
MKSATGLTGSGSRDWFIQRVSAVVWQLILLFFLVGFSAKADLTINNGLVSWWHYQWRFFLYWQFCRLSHTHGLVCGRFSLTMSLLVKWVLQRKVYALYWRRLSLLQCLCTQSGVSRFSGRIDRKISWAR